jgi:pimeloyl-ACP methyl ester carboxylesterase
MDYWDPLLVNNLALHRPILIFDNAGIGRSSGEVATTYKEWGDHIIALVDALGYKKIDLLGFSMGGCVVQMVALTRPDLVRKLIIAGSTASIPREIEAEKTGMVRENADMKFFYKLAAADESEIEEAIAYSFFYETDAGRAAAKAYWNRTLERTIEPRMPVLGPEGTQRQTDSYTDWVTFNPENSYERLGELKMPTLVVKGDNDVLVPTSRSWEMFVRIPNAQIHIYPRCGHGFLWEYAELFAAHLNQFLDDFGGVVAKL